MRLNEGYENKEYIVDHLYVLKKEKNIFSKYKINEGSKLRIIKKHKHFPMIVEVENNRISFSNKLAKNIEVTPYV